MSRRDAFNSHRGPISQRHLRTLDDGHGDDADDDPEKTARFSTDRSNNSTREIRAGAPNESSPQMKLGV